jgi:hypothetical protein
VEEEPLCHVTEFQLDEASPLCHVYTVLGTLMSTLPDADVFDLLYGAR